MALLYNIGIFFLGLSIRIASLGNEKAKKWILGRKQFFNKLPEIDRDRKLVWFHCASLGEFDQGLPLMNELKSRQPDILLLVTFFSPSGMEHYQKRSHQADQVLYLPLDTKRNARRFIRYFKPEMTFFVKYEFWSNYIMELKRSGSKIYNISGNFREDQAFFKWYGSYFRKTLTCFDHFFVQNEYSRKLLSTIGIKNVTVSGDSRFDKVLDNKAQLIPDNRLAQFCQGQKVFIIGSSWPQDEQILLPVINQIEGKVIIAPHNIDEKHISGITQLLQRSFVKYTDKKADLNCEVMVLDTIGHLSSAYSFGQIAYVGGGFSGSLHNILEPAVFGLPVIFGPKYKRFPEAKQFIEEGFGFSVNTTEELMKALDEIHENYEVLSKKETAFIERNAGVSNKILDTITSS